MYPFIKHTYLEYCNKEVDWLPADTESRYNEHLKTNWGELNQHGWINYPKFTYKFNSHGFRSDEFSDEPSIMFLGCSHTAGIGLPQEHTWARIVASKLNLKCFNLGIGAGSNDTAFRLGQHYIPLLKPRIVVFLSTDISRGELHNIQDRIENFGVWDAEKCGYFWQQWVSNDINGNLNLLKNKLALEHICNTHNTKFVYETAINVLHHADFARDLMHCGIKSNLACAESMLEKI